jgi:uncharacterized membrane protein YdjX (TVP38/TMEM64 family)
MGKIFMRRREYYLRLLVLVLFVVCILAARFFGLYEYITFEKLSSYGAYLTSYVQEHYALAVSIYLLVFTAAMLLLLPVAIVLCVLGGFLFGAVAGTIYATISATIGSIIFFLAARYLFARIIHRAYAKQYEVFDREFEKNGARYIIMMHLLPATPIVLMAFCAGISKLPLTTFSWATFVGLLPGTCAYVLVGSHVQSIGLHADMTSALVLAARLAAALMLAAFLLWMRRSR